tara:strand:- start:297 stop:692 length:396 start_codon:yes stop_codon:yes gene_type:complete
MAKLQQAEQASQPTPEQQEMQQAVAQAQMEFQQSQTAALSGQAVESQARAQKIATETQLLPEELEIDRIKAVTTNLQAGTKDDKEFERRLKIADVALKEKDLSIKEKNIKAQSRQQEQSAQTEQQLLNRLS